MRTPNKKIICFDMDGTLINSLPAHAKAFVKSFEFNNLAKKRESEIMPLIGLKADKAIRKLYPNISQRKLERVIEKYHEYLNEETYKYSKPIAGVMDALRKLKKEYKLVLISGTQHSEIEKLLKFSDINQNIFDIVLGGDEVKHQKPSPDAIKKVEKLTDEKVEWMIGDTTWDIESGKLAKVRTVAVLTGKTSIENLVKSDPTMIIQSVYMLPEALRA